MKKVYQQIATSYAALLNCLAADEQPHPWTERHEERIEQLVKDYLPSGSGIDSGVSFDYDESTPEKLVFHSGYHHMNENGYYDGWSHFKIIVTPSLQFGFNLRLQSVGPFKRKYADTKEYILDTFYSALDTEIQEEL